MYSPAKQVISAQMLVELAAAVEDMANELDRSKRRHQRVMAGLADVDEGRIVSHADMLDFTVRLKEQN